MAICKAEAVVLRDIPLRDTSKIVTFYTKQYGRIKAVAKGARKPGSRFGAGLEPATYVSIVFYRKENRDLHTLSQCDIISPFRELKGDLGLFTYASAICELTDLLMPPEEPNGDLFAAMVSAFRGMEGDAARDGEKYLWYFELRLLRALGYSPHLSDCLSCGGRIGGKTAFFSIPLGGILCERCGASTSGAFRIKPGTAKFLERLQTAKSFRMISNLRSTALLRGEISDVLRGFIEYHTEGRGELKSLQFLDKVRFSEVSGLPSGSKPVGD